MHDSKTANLVFNLAWGGKKQDFSTGDVGLALTIYVPFV